jgi:predicted MPP superfamily phosphohydrolase
LLNEAVRVTENGAALWRVELDDAHFYGLHDFDKALRDVPPASRELRILLAHSPEVIPEVSARGFHLYLTGHTHAGQICLPGGWPPMVNARWAVRFAPRLLSLPAPAAFGPSGAGVGR